MLYIVWLAALDSRPQAHARHSALYRNHLSGRRSFSSPDARAGSPALAPSVRTAPQSIPLSFRCAQGPTPWWEHGECAHGHFRFRLAFRSIQAAGPRRRRAASRSLRPTPSPGKGLVSESPTKRRVCGVLTCSSFADERRVLTHAWLNLWFVMQPHRNTDCASLHSDSGVLEAFGHGWEARTS